MAFVAPKGNAMQILSNALTGVSKGINDANAVKLRSIQIQDQRNQFEQQLDLNFKKLDEQIRKANMDDATRREMQQLRIDAADALQDKRIESSEKMTREGFVSAEKRARISAGPAYDRNARDQAWREHQSRMSANESRAIRDFLVGMPDVGPPPDLNDFDGNPESFSYVSAVAAYNDRIKGNTDMLAQQLAGFGGTVDSATRRKAQEIVLNPEEFEKRYIQDHQAYHSAKQASRAHKYTYGMGAPSFMQGGAGKTTADSFGQSWKLDDVVESTSLWFSDDQGYTIEEQQKSKFGYEPALQSFVRPNEHWFQTRIANDIKNLSGEHYQIQQGHARTAVHGLIDLGAQYKKLASKKSTSPETLKGLRKEMVEQGSRLDVLMGYRDGRSALFAKAYADYESMPNKPALLITGKRKGESIWKQGMYEGFDVTPPEGIVTFAHGAKEALDATIAAQSRADVDKDVENALNMFGDAFNLTDQQNLYLAGGTGPTIAWTPEQSDEIHAEIERIEKEIGRSLTLEEKGRAIQTYIGEKELRK